MKALVYGGNAIRNWKTVAKPGIVKPTDAIVKVLATTICGTDLHILKGDMPEVAKDRILGHEAVGIVDEVGSEVSNFKPGDKVVVSCISSCGKCSYCKRNLQAHCFEGGWILGYKIDGTQAEYVRTPFADNSLFHAPPGVSDEALITLSDILPTANEVGVLSAHINKGDTVAIVGAGPIGLGVLILCQRFGPKNIVLIDLDDERLTLAKKLGATHTINSGKQNVKEEIYKLTSNGEFKPGADAAIECVGVPATFELCEEIIAPGGRIANVGVHGKKVDLHLQDLWIKNISISTGLVSAYSSSDLLKNIVDGTVKPESLVSHHFKLSEIEKAYDVFSHAAENQAIKMFISADK